MSITPEVAIPWTFVYEMTDQMVRIYQLCGETEKAEAFWHDNGVSPLARFLQEQEIEIPDNDTPDTEISAKVQQVLKDIALASRDDIVDYLEQLFPRVEKEGAVSKLQRYIEMIKDMNPWPENQITDVDSISNESWLVADLGMTKLRLTVFFMALYFELGKTVDPPLITGNFEKSYEDDERYMPYFDTTALCTAPKLGEVKAFMEWVLTEDAE